MNTNRIFFILFIMLCGAQALAACGSPASPAALPSEPPSVSTVTPSPTATPEPVDPAVIAQSFYQAYNEGDLETLMALVADDIKVRGGAYLTGKDRFQFNYQADLKQGFQVEISDLQVEGDSVTYNVRIYNKNGTLLIAGTETLQIKDGLIILLETQ